MREQNQHLPTCCSQLLADVSLETHQWSFMQTFALIMVVWLITAQTDEQN